MGIDFMGKKSMRYWSFDVENSSRSSDFRSATTPEEHIQYRTAVGLPHPCGVAYCSSMEHWITVHCIVQYNTLNGFIFRALHSWTEIYETKIPQSSINGRRQDGLWNKDCPGNITITLLLEDRETYRVARLAGEAGDGR